MSLRFWGNSWQRYEVAGAPGVFILSRINVEDPTLPQHEMRARNYSNLNVDVLLDSTLPRTSVGVEYIDFGDRWVTLFELNAVGRPHSKDEDATKLTSASALRHVKMQILVERTNSRVDPRTHELVVDLPC